MIKQLTYAIVAGLIALIAALFLAEFVTYPEFGFKVDSSKWSEEAKSIRYEAYPQPMTQEQWRRLNKVLARDGQLETMWVLTRKSTLYSWYWYLLVPLGFLFLLRWRFKTISIPLGIAVFAPCGIFLSTVLWQTYL